MSSHQHQTKRSRTGFSLVELAIVLVIIGLIAGAVFLGRDLIEAAAVRATIAQYEAYNAAVNTFRTKFNGIPGDLAESGAATFGLYDMSAPAAGTAGGVGNGDGNNLLEQQNVAGGELGQGEAIVFWRHLSDANLIAGSLGANLGAGTGLAGASPTSAGYLPAAKIGRGSYWAVAASGGLNYFYLGGIAFTNPNGQYAFAASITPIEAYSIDVKLDDGQPSTGIVQARGTAASTTTFLTDDSQWSSAPAPAIGDCLTGGTGAASDATNVYARTDGSGVGTTPACLLRLRFN